MSSCAMREQRPPPPRTNAARDRDWRRKPGRRPSARPAWARRSADDTVMLYGWHTVKAALENPQRRIRRLLATENAARRLAADGIAPEVTLELVRPDAIAKLLSPDAVHNGILAQADPLPPRALEDI